MVWSRECWFAVGLEYRFFWLLLVLVSHAVGHVIFMCERLHTSHDFEIPANEQGAFLFYKGVLLRYKAAESRSSLTSKEAARGLLCNYPSRLTLEDWIMVRWHITLRTTVLL